MGRGPSYPYVGLEPAIVLTRKMYDYAKRAPAAPESVVTEAWKYSSTSSSGQKVLAALKYFGLTEDAPGSNGNLIKLSARAVRILLDEEDSSERKEELRRAALAPKWYEYCWRTWGKDMPPSMRSNLMIEHGFVESTVDSFLKEYRQSIAFAGLLDEVVFPKTEEGRDTKPLLPIGTHVQWESAGVLRMPAARKLVSYSDDGDYAFVEDSSTGIPTAELIAAEKPEEQALLQPKVISKPEPVKGASTLQDSFSLPDGSSVHIQWPTSFTEDAFADFTDWLEIVKRKIKRTVRTDKPSEDLHGQ